MDAQNIPFEQMPGAIVGLRADMAELKNLFLKVIELQPNASNSEDELLTRAQVAEKLKVSLPTLNEYTKSGKIIAHRIGRRVRYKASEVTSALTQIKTSKVA